MSFYCDMTISNWSFLLFGHAACALLLLVLRKDFVHLTYETGWEVYFAFKS